MENKIPTVGDRPVTSGNHQYGLPAANSEGNLFMAVAAAAVSSLGAAILWGLITGLTGYQIGFMAIGIGFLVGFAVNKLGAGASPVYGAIAAVFALIGCLAGNLLAACHLLADYHEASLSYVLSILDLQTSMDLLASMFSPMDLLFYALAIYYAWKIAPVDTSPPVIDEDVAVASAPSQMP